MIDLRPTAIEVHVCIVRARLPGKFQNFLNPTVFEPKWLRLRKFVRKKHKVNSATSNDRLKEIKFE